MKLHFVPIFIIFLLLVLWSCGSKNDSTPCLSGTGVLSITVSPPNSTFTPPTQQFTAVAKDFNNQPVCGITFIWSDTGNFTCIDQTGLATIKKTLGSNSTPDTITAAYGAITDSTTLQFPSPPPPPTNNNGC